MPGTSGGTHGSGGISGGVSDKGNLRSSDKGDMDGRKGNGQGDGLNPNRQRGFGRQQPRIETPTLNDMKAKQGAIVSKFMTFLNRKNTAVVELYERSFYTRRPGWDSLANFIYNDLCPMMFLVSQFKTSSFIQ